MTLRWQEIVVLPEHEEEVTCDCCGFRARSIEGRLAHREAPLARYAARWRPGRPDHPARHLLFLGDWRTRSHDESRAVAAADYWGGERHGFYLRDEPPAIMAALAPWRPRFIRREQAIGRPLGGDLFAMLDAIHVKDPRLREVRGWGAAPQGPPAGGDADGAPG